MDFSANIKPLSLKNYFQYLKKLYIIQNMDKSTKTKIILILILNGNYVNNIKYSP